MQQIAKMFATLGFNVDSTGLDTFKNKLKEARADSALLSRNFRALKSAVDSANASFMRFNTNNKIKKLGGDVASSYTGFSKAVDLVNKSFASIGMQQPTTTKALGKINAAAVHGAPKWKAYGDELARVDGLLKSIQKRLRSVGGGRPPPINPPSGGGGGSGGGSGRPPPRPPNLDPFGNQGGSGRNNPFNFFRSMSPAVLLGGGLPALGYGLKEIVERGRAQQKMENTLLFSSSKENTMKDFADSLEFVKNKALEVGVASADLGKAFAQINMSAEGLNKDQRKSLLGNMSGAFAVMGASKDEQGLLFKAVNQMFSLGRIQAEEMNQLTGQGLVPRKLVYDAVKEAYKVKTNEEVQKLQKANKLDPAKIMPLVFEKMMEQAKASGAWDKYTKSSQYKQNVATEKFNQLSQKIMNGGLDRALGSIFSATSKLFEVLESLAPVLKTIATLMGVVADKVEFASQSVDSFAGQNTFLKVILITILGLLAKKLAVMMRITTATRAGASVFQVLGRYLGGTFAAILRLVFTRFNLIVFVIWEILDAARAVNKHMHGEINWVSLWIAKFDLLGAYWDNTLAKMELGWLKMTAVIHPDRLIRMNNLDENGIPQVKGSFTRQFTSLGYWKEKVANGILMWNAPTLDDINQKRKEEEYKKKHPDEKTQSSVRLPIYIDGVQRAELAYDPTNQTLNQVPVWGA